MRAWLGSGVLLLVAFPFAASEFDPFAGPTPIFVYIQTDPWAMVPGSDTPRVALYDNGELIFARKANGKFVYRHQKLDGAALHHFQRELAPLAELKRLRAWYDIAPGSSDQPQTHFYLRDGVGERTTQIYGLMDERTKLPAWTEFQGGRRPDKLPAALRKLQKFLADFDHPESPEWVPQHLEVMLWGYDYAPDESIHWPADWPALDSDRATKRGDLFSIFLPGTELARLETFLASRREKGAVEMGGKKWAADFRYTFPREQIWRAAFRRDRGAPVHADFQDRIENTLETVKRAFSFLLFAWTPTLILVSTALFAAFARLRQSAIPFPRWTILLVPLLIPIAIATLTSEFSSGLPLEEVEAVQTAIRALVWSFFPLAGILIFLARGFRWLASAAMLLHAWGVIALTLAVSL